MHPSFEVQKTYHVTIDRSCSVKDVEALRKGVLLEDGVLKCDRVLVVPGTKKELFLTIHSGKYRVIRRAFESLGYTVLKLNRSLYAGLTTRKMARGEWRDLTQSEVQRLKQLLN
jgi:23S rRNA pseudouridine2605 synthase